MSISQTVADSKRRFYNAYPRVIPGLYRRVVDELLVDVTRHAIPFSPARALSATARGPQPTLADHNR